MEKLEDLVQRYKNGEKEAFTKIIERTRKKLYVIALARMQNYADAEDVVQETFVKACKNIHSLKDNSKFNSWIITILINECNRVFSNRKYCYSFEDFNCEYFVSDEDCFKYIEDELDFYAILNTKNVEDRTILALYYTEEYTTKEISKILSINENTVKSRIKRAVEKIKKDKKEEEYGQF